jgi:hypothetical protein
MKIAIPSYNREKVLCNKTLKLLLDSGVNQFDIDLFLYDTDQNEIYDVEIFKVFGEHKINVVVTDILDLGERLNYILNEYYDEGEEVLLIEDDILRINKNLLEVCKEGFKLCRENNLFIWGISPTDSKLYHKEGYSTNFKFIIGVLYGVIVRKDKDLNVSITYKCDFERSILYHKKDGGMIRFNDVCINTTYRALGGLGNDNKNGRKEKELDAVKQMIEKYPDYCYQNSKKEREIKLFKKK